MFQIHSRQAFPQSEDIDLASMPTPVFDSSRKMPLSVLNSPRETLAPASIFCLERQKQSLLHLQRRMMQIICLPQYLNSRIS